MIRSGSLPLPYRIPNPDNRQRHLLNNLGIRIIDEVPGESYVRYGLPSGWKMINDSVEYCQPSFFIIDDKTMTRVIIYGTWDEIRDNNLVLRILKPPDVKLYQPIKNR